MWKKNFVSDDSPIFGLNQMSTMQDIPKNLKSSKAIEVECKKKRILILKMSRPQLYYFFAIHPKGL